MLKGGVGGRREGGVVKGESPVVPTAPAWS